MQLVAFRKTTKICPAKKLGSTFGFQTKYSRVEADAVFTTALFQCFFKYQISAPSDTLEPAWPQKKRDGTCRFRFVCWLGFQFVNESLELNSTDYTKCSTMIWMPQNLWKHWKKITTWTLKICHSFAVNDQTAFNQTKFFYIGKSKLIVRYNENYHWGELLLQRWKLISDSPDIYDSPHITKIDWRWLSVVSTISFIVKPNYKSTSWLFFLHVLSLQQDSLSRLKQRNLPNAFSLWGRHGPWFWSKGCLSVWRYTVLS